MVEETISNTVDKTVKDRIVFFCNYTIILFFGISPVSECVFEFREIDNF